MHYRGVTVIGPLGTTPSVMQIMPHILYRTVYKSTDLPQMFSITSLKVRADELGGFGIHVGGQIGQPMTSLHLSSGQCC